MCNCFILDDFVEIPTLEYLLIKESGSLFFNLDVKFIFGLPLFNQNFVKKEYFSLLSNKILFNKI